MRQLFIKSSEDVAEPRDTHSHFLKRGAFFLTPKKIELSEKNSLQRYYKVSKIVFTQIYIYIKSF